MKKYIMPAGICLLLSAVCATIRASYDDLASKADRQLFFVRNYPVASLPSQAWVCDVVVVGRVTNACDYANRVEARGFVDIEVDSYWRGDQGTNSFRIQMLHQNQPPATNTPVLFFLTKYSSLTKLRNTPPMTSKHAPRVDMDVFRTNAVQDGIWLYRDSSLSWFHMDEKNADITAFASNLVFAVNSNNTNAFYEIVRDGCSGYEWFPPNQDEWQIFFDSMSALIYPDFYFSTNFIFQTICKDPEFPQDVWTRHQFDGYLNSTYGTKFGFEFGTVIEAR